MKKFKVSVEVNVPDNITEGMLNSFFMDLEQMLYNHIGEEFDEDGEDEFSVENYSMWKK